MIKQDKVYCDFCGNLIDNKIGFVTMHPLQICDCCLNDMENKTEEDWKTLWNKTIKIK